MIQNVILADMRKLRLIVASIVLGLFVAAPVPATAQAATNFGGNRASDYQPPTRNPQSGATANLQPNTSSIQTSQGTVSQQDLPAVSNLRVTTTASTANLSTAADAPAEHGAKPSWLEVIILAILLLVILYILNQRRRKQPANATTAIVSSTTKTTPTPEVKTAPVKKKRNTTRTGKKKTKSKKKTRK